MVLVNTTGFTTTKERLQKLPYLDMGKDVYLAAAVLYRSLRAKGVTVPSTDTSIAALAILNSMPIFTSDEHFSIIAANSKLELYKQERL